MSARGVVVDGVTGAGKSQTLRALAARPGMNGAVIVPEEETLGELMDEELPDASMPAPAKLWRLDAVLARVRAATDDTRFVLERFHPTYFALMGDWPLVAHIDDELAARGFRLVLLTVAVDALATRGLHRVDRAGTPWTGEMITAFGSEEAALAAIAASQDKRIEALERTRMRSLRIDTTKMRWEDYADEIDAFLSA